MTGPPPSVLDEIYGVQALGALLVGDLESALDVTRAGFDTVRRRVPVPARPADAEHFGASCARAGTPPPFATPSLTPGPTPHRRFPLLGRAGLGASIERAADCGEFIIPSERHAVTGARGAFGALESSSPDGRGARPTGGGVERDPVRRLRGTGPPRAHSPPPHAPAASVLPATSGIPVVLRGIHHALLRRRSRVGREPAHPRQAGPRKPARGLSPSRRPGGPVAHRRFRRGASAVDASAASSNRLASPIAPPRNSRLRTIVSPAPRPPGPGGLPGTRASSPRTAEGP